MIHSNDSEEKQIINLTESEDFFIGLIQEKKDKKIKIRLSSEEIFIERQDLFSNYYSKDEVMGLLQSLSSKKILEKKVGGCILVCPNCGENISATILTCSKCGSSKICIKENMRHIKCGYLGPKEKYYDGINIRCPNCSEIIYRPILGESEDQLNREMHFECSSCGERVKKDDYELICLKCNQKYKNTDASVITIINYELSSDFESKKKYYEEDKKQIKNEVKTRTVIPGKPNIKRIKRSSFKTIKNVKNILGKEKNNE